MALRTCIKCGFEARTEKDLDEFVLNIKSRFKRQNLCRKCRNEYRFKLYKSTSSYTNSVIRKRRKELRNLVVDRLSGACMICGFVDRRALQIDHINGGGNRDKKDNRRNVYKYYKSLLEKSDEELYSKYQCLCANCNWIKKYEKNEVGDMKC